MQGLISYVQESSRKYCFYNYVMGYVIVICCVHCIETNLDLSSDLELGLAHSDVKFFEITSHSWLFPCFPHRNRILGAY
jgi:hypothetical protein